MNDTQRSSGNIWKESMAVDVIVRGSASGFAQEIVAGSHPLTADEPAAAGGTDTGGSQSSRRSTVRWWCLSCCLDSPVRRRGYAIFAHYSSGTPYTSPGSIA